MTRRSRGGKRRRRLERSHSENLRIPSESSIFKKSSRSVRTSTDFAAGGVQCAGCWGGFLLVPRGVSGRQVFPGFGHETCRGRESGGPTDLRRGAPPPARVSPAATSAGVTATIGGSDVRPYSSRVCRYRSASLRVVGSSAREVPRGIRESSACALVHRPSNT